MSTVKFKHPYASWDQAKLEFPPLNEILVDVPQLVNEENLLLLFSCIDLTSLETVDHPEKIRAICEKVNQFQTFHPEFPSVASICIYPSLVETVKNSLKKKGVGITSVIGGFPSSQTYTEVKELETEMALLDGATEVDLVMLVGLFLEGKDRAVFHEIHEIKKLLTKAHLKVILETGALPGQESIYHSALIAMEAGADFVKTSTGKINPAATPEAAYAMCIAIAEFYKHNKLRKGFKPAGGIADSHEALKYLAIVKNILGNEWLNPRLFRIGASRLANALLADYYADKENEFSLYF